MLFAHGSGSSRFSVRNQAVAGDLNAASLGTLLFDLLTAEEHEVDRVTRELRFDIEPDLPQEVLTDGVKLKQILLNLLGNAVKFTPHGVITLTASLSKDRLVFGVADTGIGIPADKLDRIFDAFHQVREGPAVDGTGLGLAITRKIVEDHHGELTATNAKAGGACLRPRAVAQLQPIEQARRDGGRRCSQDDVVEVGERLVLLLLHPPTTASST